MIIDDIDFADLPVGKEEAFVEYVRRLKKQLGPLDRQDLEINWDQQHDCYSGEYEPRRLYVSSILAFLDEYDLDGGEIKDISGLPKVDFGVEYSAFSNSVNYIVTRYKLRSSRYCNGSAGTPILIEGSYKDEIGKHLDQIRKIINQEISDENKKDILFKKIASLQLEVDKSRTTIDAVFSRIYEISQGVNEYARDCEPLIKKISQLGDIFIKGSKRDDKLLETKRKKALPKPDDKSPDVNEEIPF
ncbi:hypothetical protein [Hirschia litorea]|uniref:Uncharacterized protein n=1 Tax=Hirschia litorea TaxID=1199156 RepID=A0ABW2IMD1_9PROT